jgi:hypothetical protein
MYCLKYILMRSGRANVRPINMRYLPMVAMGVRISFFILGAKVAFFYLYKCKRMSDFVFSCPYTELF